MRSFFFGAPRAALVLPVLLTLAACGPNEPPKAPEPPKPKPLEVSPEPPFELSPLPEPPGVVGIARIVHPESSSRLLGNWSGFPVPTAADALREVVGDELASVIDLDAPVDAVVRFGGSARSPQVAFVVSVPLVSLEAARAKLGKYKLSPMSNGMTKVEGLVPEAGEEEGAKEAGKVCALSPSAGASKARIVCGDAPGIEALAGFAVRTLAAKPVAPGDPDIHAEVRAAPFHDAVTSMRTLLPALVGGFLDSKNGVGLATREIVEGSIGDLADFAVDSDKLTFELYATPEGAKTQMRYAFKSHDATLTKIMVYGADKVGPPPATLLRMPPEVDFGAWSRPTDKGLFERPRKLLGALLEESFEGELPAAERHALVDGFVSHTLPLFEGGWVFAHGFDVDAAREKVGAMHKDDDAPGLAAEKLTEERKKAAFEQVAGFTLAHLQKPQAEVAQVAKDWVALATKLSKAKKKKDSPTVKVTPSAASLALPAKTVHVEITVPRRAHTNEKGKVTFTPSAIVCHLYVVPGDGAEADTSWIGAGCDAKLVAAKLLASRNPASVGTGPTLGSRPESRELVASSSRSGFFMTPRTLAWTKLVDKNAGPLGALGKDAFATALFITTPEAPSKDAPGGSVRSTMVIPKAAMGTGVSVMMR